MSNSVSEASTLFLETITLYVSRGIPSILDTAAGVACILVAQQGSRRGLESILNRVKQSVEASPLGLARFETARQHIMERVENDASEPQVKKFSAAGDEFLMQIIHYAVTGDDAHIVTAKDYVFRMAAEDQGTDEITRAFHVVRASMQKQLATTPLQLQRLDEAKVHVMESMATDIN